MHSYKSNYLEKLALITDYFSAYELYLGEVTQPKLEAWVQQELGNCNGDWQHYDSVLHVISGNTNHAGLQSVLRALIVGGQHYIKLPSQGAQEVESCLVNLPEQLKKNLNWSREWQPQWLEQADVVVAYGSDETMQDIQSQLTDSQIFIGHGHKVGMAYVDMTASQALADIAQIAQDLVKDVVAFNQQGCLSLQVVYVDGSVDMRRLLAQAVAKEFEQVTQGQQLAEYIEYAVTPDELARIAYAREAFELKTLLESSDFQLWKSELNSEKPVWTVAIDDSMAVEQLMGNCWLWVKPWGVSVENQLDFLEQTQLNPSQLSSLAIYPYNKEYRDKLNYAYWDRRSPLGYLQRPDLDWKQGNRENLADLIKK